MKSCYGYIRVSTVKQGAFGVSLQEQKEAIARYADRNSCQIAQWFEERETAAKRGRPVFSTMLRLLRTRQAEGVIIHKIDRSARNLKDWSDLGELIDSGVQVHFAGDSLDLHTRGGRLSADIQAVVAADYIRNLREETRKGFYGRLKQGLYPLPAPLGYLNTGKGKPKEIDPITGPNVRKLFELYATGRYSLPTLRVEARKIGIVGRRGKHLSLNGLSCILHNPFYIGVLKIDRTGEIFPGAHTPLIPKGLFDRVQGILEGKTAVRVIRHDFLFKRLLKCANCGGSLTGEKQKGHVYYRCQKPECKGTCVREEVVEKAFEKALEPLVLGEDELRYIRAVASHLTREWKDERAQEEKSLSLQLSRTTDLLNRTVDAFLEGNLEKDLYEERKRSLLLEKITLEEKHSDLKTPATSGGERVVEFLELAKTALLRYQMGNHDEKREILKTTTSNFLVSGKNVSTRLSFPFSEVEKRPSLPHGDPYRGRLRTFVFKLGCWLMSNNVDDLGHENAESTVL